MGLIEPGQITVAFTAYFPPISSIDAKGNFVGFDVDIMRAVAEDLGLKINYVNVKTDGLFPGISAKRYDVGMGALVDTKKREQSVDLVDYLQVGSGFIVSTGNPKKVKTLDDLCGLTVASTTGDIGTMYAHDQTEKCVAQGKPGVTVREFPEGAQAMLQLYSGRADVMIHGYPLSVYLVQQSDGRLEVAGEQFNVAPEGMAIFKGNVALRNALMTGLDHIIANGKYAAILAKYHISEAALPHATYNQPLR
ncbi:ABC transporter substrate-binding protein [Paraburkholderia sp.]|uniref:ABC transporter substrate-binding protein n=1 Tax=Paraburkholderia sp. TaxID=1926495 RepID=UPI0039E5B9DD